MALTSTIPATLFDMAELSGAGNRLQWAVAREMWRGGETMAIREGDQLIALIGLYPIEGGAEAWFNVHPRAGAFMPELIRLMRLTLASCEYPEIVVVCTSKAGRRIARLCGFEFVREHELGEVWYGKPIRGK